MSQEKVLIDVILVCERVLTHAWISIIHATFASSGLPLDTTGDRVLQKCGAIYRCVRSVASEVLSIILVGV